MIEYSKCDVLTLVICLLVCVPIVAGSVGGSPNSSSLQEEIDPDDVLIRIDLRDDGSAAVAFEYRVRLDDENETAAFESLQADVEEDPSSYTDRFADRMNGTVGAAAEETGREMAIDDVGVAAEKRNFGREYGVLTYSFEWNGFAVANETHVTAGDVLSGFFLDEDTRLQMTWPSEYSAVTVSPDPDERRDGVAVWSGPRDFATGEPMLVVSTGDPTPDEGFVAPPVLAGVLAVAIVGGLLFVRYRARGLDGRRRGDGPASNAEDTPSEDGPAAAVEPGTDDESPEPVASDDLLSNEEQVLRVIEERGGRVKQQEVVEALGWTDAKTSQVVSSMREEGTIDGFRLGRENVLTLPDENGT